MIRRMNSSRKLIRVGTERRNSMDISREIAEIGSLITSAALIMAVRKEVSKCVESGFVVTDGRHVEGGSGYDVVVEASSDLKGVARRIRSSVQNVDVEKIAEGVLGVRTARRGSRNG